MRFCILIISILLPTLAFSKVQNQSDIQVAFRYDDFSKASDKKVETGLFELFEKHGYSFTCSVIPMICTGDIYSMEKCRCEKLDPAKSKLLRDAFDKGIIDLALHGYYHQTATNTTVSEFQFVEAKVQEQKIVDGKKMLEGLTGSVVNIFVPPWNNYDKTTIRLLEKYGFTTISADYCGYLHPTSEIKYVPFSCTPAELKKAIEQVRQSKSENKIVVVMMHQYDFKESNPEGLLSLQMFEKELDWLSKQKDVKVVALKDVVFSSSDPYGAERMGLNNSIMQISNKFHPSLKPAELYFMGNKSDLSEIKTKFNWYLIRLAGVSFLLFSFLIRIVFKKFLPNKPILILPAMLGFVFSVAVLLLVNSMSWKVVIVGCVFAGFALAISGNIFLLSRNH